MRALVGSLVWLVPQAWEEWTVVGITLGAVAALAVGVGT